MSIWHKIEKLESIVNAAKSTNVPATASTQPWGLIEDPEAREAHDLYLWSLAADREPYRPIVDGRFIRQ